MGGAAFNSLIYGGPLKSGYRPGRIADGFGSEPQNGPGLTLFVGRNGSGKSSFAEGVEVALTGRNERIKGKTAEWQKQWRNIHDGANAEITVEFQVDGEIDPLTVRRLWTGKNLDDAVTGHQQERQRAA